MSKKAIRSILFLMSISLLGLVAFQAYWISNRVTREALRFDRDIQQMLSQVADEVVKEEVKQLVLKAASPKKTTRILQEEVEDIKVIVKQATAIDLDAHEDKTIIINAGNGQTTVTTTVRSENTNQAVITDQVVEKYESQKDLLNEVVEKMAFQFAVNDVSLEARLKNIPMDTLLYKALEDAGFSDAKFSYLIKDLTLDSIVQSMGMPHLTTASSGYSTSISEDGELHFTIQNKQLFVLQSLWKTLLLSLVLIIVLVGTFVYTINSILKQKRISTMKADFINNMTHEFKTPVATISLAIDSILHEQVKNKPEEIEKLGVIIKKENSRMNHQIESLLNIAQFDKESFELKEETIDVHEMLTELKENFEVKTSQQAGDFALFLQAEQSLIQGDSMHFYNVLRNIIDNGIKFSNDAFRIKISTSSSENTLCIRISDQGIGMNKETQQKIFTRFYRKTEGDLHTTKGFGLGLAYAKEVLDKMNAQLRVESELNKGSTFTITLQRRA